MTFGDGTVYRNGARPKGSRNRRTEELWNLLSKRGDRDPVEFMSQLVTDGTIPLEVRLQAANSIAPYRHSKCGATPPLRFLEHEFEYPHPNPTSEAEISANIGALNQAYASSNLDLDSYQTMLAGQHQHVNALKARETLPDNTDIRIIGGLPELPGRNITMPQLNGHETLGLVAPNDPPITPPQDPDQPPAIPPEQQEPQP
jgi:hypothetical protein